jgi:ribosomal protein S18 acetylase RimI-like enzyme
MKVTRWHLVMDTGDALRPAAVPDPAPEVRQVLVPLPEWSRFLYVAVGRHWHWTDRLAWTEDDWLGFLSRPGIETWVAWSDGTPAGYHELELRADGTVEIIYFGLLPPFIGRGWGGHLLTHAVRRAWALGAGRVILNTCSLDHPGALAAYRARGFRVEREEEYERETPVPQGPFG